jgi:hypothetical protein
MACAADAQVRRAAATQPAPQRQADPGQARSDTQKVSSGRRGRPETGVPRKEWFCGLFDLHGKQARSEHSSRGTW